MKAKLITVLLLAMHTASLSFAQPLNKARLDSFFDLLASKDKAMGSVSISKNGSIIYNKAIGYAVLNDSVKISADANTRYRVGSITKMFTATIIFQLIEAGKLSLSTTIEKFFPAIPNADKITIGHMLGHRSGIHSFTNDPDFPGWMTKPKTSEELIAIIAKSKPDFQPNEKSAYSNSNFVLLGYIIETITKKTYAKALAERITAKLKLSATYVGEKVNPKNHESFSYRYLGKWIQQPESDMSIPGAAGAIVSTPADLTKFIEALFAGKLVSQNSLTQMKSIRDGFGMGMFQIPFFEKKGLGHNGSIDAFVSNVVYFPEDSVSMAYCSNGQSYPFNDVLMGLLSIYFNSNNYAMPAFKEVALTADELDKYTGVYSSTQLPLKITISRNGNVLVAQATGQSAFQLEAIEKDHFKFDMAGVKMDFDTAKNEMVLLQAGGRYLFIKEK